MARPRVSAPAARARPSAAATPAPAAAIPALAIFPSGTFHVAPASPAAAVPGEEPPLPADAAERILAAFGGGTAQGFLHLATVELGTALPPDLAFGREIGRRFLAELCRVDDLEARRNKLDLPASPADIEELLRAAPPMIGAEYLSETVLAHAWAEMSARVEAELRAFRGTVQEYLQKKIPAWNVMGRVCFHLAENRANERAPFAFLATYARAVSAEGRPQHAPLAKAVEEHAGAGNKAELLRLLAPVKRAAERSAVVRELVDSGAVFHPLAWSPRQAYAFLQDTAVLEESGVVVRVPDWWRARASLRPQVRVTVGSKTPSQVGAAAMLDFDVRLVLGGERLSADEIRSLLEGAETFRYIKGRWIEVDRQKLGEVLSHWRDVERRAARGEISFLEGMRLLAGVPGGGDGGESEASADPAWTQVAAGPWLQGLLDDLQNPRGGGEADPGSALKGTLRPYQRDGVAWLWLLSRLGLGGCLADDMGLGKTVQVLALFLLLKKHGRRGPHLLVVPASLLGNWRAEMDRFAPGLAALFAHPSFEGAAPDPGKLGETDVVVTTYGQLLRAPWIAEGRWGTVVLDEAQAIKNPGARQTRAVKGLKSEVRLALTGTPVENRLDDLWSLFDFLCPGLLGSAASFRRMARRMAEDRERGYSPLRALLRPYILRRMKTDRTIVSDLPDKTELNVYCPLTNAQAALYRKAVSDLAAELEQKDGMERRGLILAYLMRFKQICNHPSQWSGDGAFAPEQSGKLGRLRELCEPIAARQEKALVFTQFREMTRPLAGFLEGVFGRPGLVLHGETPVKARADLVAAFQREEGPPFFVLSLKAGGTGLTLTAASHVIHFDRWWNPAVENQATDRAYRIGQRRNVLVHKFVCRGTIEEKIDALIAGKRGLSEEILAGGGEAWLTELPSDELLRLVSLDLHSALEVE
jgi:non-specific serine/threonine protein kinase